MSHLLDVKNLVTRFYTDDGVVYAVNGISYTLNEGESMAIVGESGSGKSVGVLSLMGLIPQPPGKIDDGEVWFKGRDLTKLSKSELRDIRGMEISMIFQDPMTSLNPVLSIGRQLSEGMRRHQGITRKEARFRAAELLRLVGIPNAADRLNDFPHQFSGGQRQRIMIAMALSCSPSLLIADEPTTALDVTIQAQIVALVKALKRELGMAIIWITHDLGIVAGLVEKVAVMYGGFIVEHAPVIGLYTETSHPYTLGLLESLPSVEMTKQERLIPIEGSPPDLTVAPIHCAFAPRCRYASREHKCWDEIPPLYEVSPGHFSACFRAAEVRADTLKAAGELSQ
jgi:oligopeptide transport system ATP-binding protein